MLIEEQIKIARMIASGTPREVAIQEQFRGKMPASADRSGAVEAQSGKRQPKINYQKVKKMKRIRNYLHQRHQKQN